jgi:hypothetical protein
MIALETQRVQHLLAARLLLRQLRNAGDVWSDGRIIHRGVDLVKLRQDTLARIVNLKEKNPVKRRVPTMLRISKNLASSPGYLGQEDGETVGAWLIRLLERHVHSNDNGSIERAKVARRFLRRNFPEHAALLSSSHRFNHRELTHIARSRAAYRWKVAHPVILEDQGVTVNAGTTAIPAHMGFCVEVGDRLFEISDKDVRKAGRLPVYGLEDLSSHTAVKGI